MSNLAINPYTNTSPNVYTAPTHPGHAGSNQSNFSFGQSGSSSGLLSLLTQIINLLQQGNSSANTGYQAQPQNHYQGGRQGNQQPHQWPSQGGQQQPNHAMRNTSQQPQQWNNVNPNHANHQQQNIPQAWVNVNQQAGAGQLGSNLGHANAGAAGHAAVGVQGNAGAVGQLGANLGKEHLGHQGAPMVMTAMPHQNIGAGMTHQGTADMNGAMPGHHDNGGRYIGPMQGMTQQMGGAAGGMMTMPNMGGAIPNAGMPEHGGMAGHEMANHNDFVGEDGNIKPGHDFYAHVSHLYPETLAQDQSRYGGYSFINDDILVGRSPITGMKPVIDQAINDIMKVPANRNLPAAELESKIANRLTQLNDWTALTKDTQEQLVDLTGIDFGEMTKAEREKSINHLLHSPLPFGAVQDPLRPDMRVDLSNTHTLDKDKTLVSDLGNGQFNITLISNNNNGSHTGHNLGSFVLQLAPGMSVEQAKEMANAMVINANRNNELYLSDAARAQLLQYKVPA